jgi:hypothetical protein
MKPRDRRTLRLPCSNLISITQSENHASAILPFATGDIRRTGRDKSLPIASLKPICLTPLARPVEQRAFEIDRYQKAVPDAIHVGHMLMSPLIAFSRRNPFTFISRSKGLVAREDSPGAGLHRRKPELP